MSVVTTDFISISDHFGRYCWAVDEGDENAWIALWSEDAVFEGSGMHVQGHEQLRALVRQVQRSGGGKTRHLIMDMFCDYVGGPDTVIVSFYNLVTNWAERAKFVGVVLTKDVLHRQGQGWLIKHSVMHMLSAS